MIDVDTYESGDINLVRGNLDTIFRYTVLSPAIAEIHQIIHSKEWEHKEFGKYGMLSEGAHYQYGEYIHHEDDNHFEAHRRYADFQFIVSGDEIIKYADTSHLSEEGEYDAEKDYQMLYGDGQKEYLQAGEWLLLFPEDAHRPGIKWKNGKSIKIVVKIPMELINAGQ